MKHNLLYENKLRVLKELILKAYPILTAEEALTQCLVLSRLSQTENKKELNKAINTLQAKLSIDNPFKRLCSVFGITAEEEDKPTIHEQLPTKEEMHREALDELKGVIWELINRKLLFPSEVFKYTALYVDLSHEKDCLKVYKTITELSRRFDNDTMLRVYNKSLYGMLSKLHGLHDWEVNCYLTTFYRSRGDQTMDADSVGRLRAGIAAYINARNTAN